MESYRKSSNYVEVIFYTGQNTEAVVSILNKCKVAHEAKSTPLNFGLDKTYYLNTVTFTQDGNTFVLTKGKYLVQDNAHTFTVYSEERFKKLFERFNHVPF